MLQSNFGPAGNLELVVRSGDHLEHYFRDDAATWAWHGPTPIAGTTGVSGQHAVLQSSLAAAAIPTLGYRAGFSEAATVMGLVAAAGVLVVLYPVLTVSRRPMTAAAPR